ncbi:hypothetical protein HBE96_08515 [Clostridium sp. P21]|uniref:Uncharacterized protein n=1 Tax=Clostridium muellerianum TaxID=2716538 RepID=A0A7Y0EG12_9CLOT|nr:hypothetical protein [Clostridium muellerianum]NMM62737.1 hypothetical protein [Clostridium muellerianum]
MRTIQRGAWHTSVGEHNFSNLEPLEPMYLSTLDNYIDFLFPSLLANEKIALFFRRDIPRVFYFENKELLKLRLKQGLKDCDTFITLSSVKSEAKTKEGENMSRRFCLGFDLDKKDFKGKFETIQEFTNHFKVTTGGLFIHYVIDSGHGYHIYIGIEETTDIARVTSITRRFAVLCGADIANISQAQSLRLPGTLNHKDKESPLSVNIVSAYTNDNKYRRYTLDFLESKLKKLEKATGIGRPVTRKKSITRKFRGMYPCVAKMLETGVPKGERNKCLGRIVSYFRDCAKVPQSEALEIVLSWNETCNSLCVAEDAKSDDEVIKDFNRYWKPKDNKEYSLLGCLSDRNSFSSILVKYCDEARCPKCRRGPTEDSTQFYILDGRYLTDDCLRTLKGYAYVILKVLIESKKAYKVSELITLTGLSEQKVSRSMKALLELNLITKSATGVAVYKAKNYTKSKQFVTLPVKLFELLGTGEISQQELKLYITIRRNAYLGVKCTYEALGKVLILDKHHVYTVVKHRMVDHGLLEIEHKPTGTYVQIGSTNVEKSFNYYRFPLEIQDT